MHTRERLRAGVHGVRTQLALRACGSRTLTLSARERPRAGLRGARAQLAKGALDAALDVRIAHHQHARLVAAHQHHLQRPVTRCRWQSVLQITQHTMTAQTGRTYLQACKWSGKPCRGLQETPWQCLEERTFAGTTASSLASASATNPGKGLQQPRPSSRGL